MATPLIIPCAQKVNCAGSDNPLANLTSEAPDSEIFIGVNFGQPQLQPPLGWSWNNPRGFSFCGSNVSQTDADLCAGRNTVIDETDDPIGGDGGHWHDPGDHPAMIFTNTIQQCSVICPDGLPFTYQVAAGLFNALTQAEADATAQSYACRLAHANEICIGNFTTPACNGSEYDSVATVSGRGPFTIAIVGGALPPGLALNSGSSPASFNALELAGTPTMPGTFSFAVRLTNPAGNFMQKTFIIGVLGISPASLPDAKNGSAYNQQLSGIGGTAPYSFEIVEDSLPDGLTMDATGLISGTPTTNGSSDFTVEVTDSTGATCAQRYTLNVASSTCINPALTAWHTGVPSSNPAWITGTGDSISVNGQTGPGVAGACAYVGNLNCNDPNVTNINAHIVVTATSAQFGGPPYIGVGNAGDASPYNFICALGAVGVLDCVIPVGNGLNQINVSTQLLSQNSVIQGSVTFTLLP